MRRFDKPIVTQCKVQSDECKVKSVSLPSFCTLQSALFTLHCVGPSQVSQRCQRLDYRKVSLVIAA